MLPSQTTEKDPPWGEITFGTLHSKVKVTKAG